jgi:hypothetical protein
VDEESLTVKGLAEEELIKSAVPANQAKIKELLGWAEASIVF